MKAKRKSQFSKYGRQDKIILSIGYFLIALFVLAIIVPIFYIIVASFMDPVTLQNKGITFDFSKWTITAYQRVMSNGAIWIGFKNAVIYSVVFTVVSVVVTLLVAYPMSRTDFKGRKLFNVIFVITMFFGGGLIPTYLLISNLGLLDSMWAVILPGAFSVWNMIIARTYYQGIPGELREAAEVDGANELVFFFKILLPVCTPNIATIAFISFTRPNAETDQISYLQDLSVITRAMARPIGRQIITMNARKAQSRAFKVSNWPRWNMA